MAARNKGRSFKPTRTASPPDKSIRRSEEPAKFQTIMPSWGVSKLDREGNWGWDNVSLDDLWLQIIPKLKEYENMTWADIIKKKRSHNIPRENLIRQARKRLDQIGLGGLDELFSLRLTGKIRIWGVLDRGTLAVIWYDPRHEVCPTSK